MRTLFLALAVITTVGAAVAACGTSTDDEPFCNAGQPIYCECANGESGTRDCNAEGTALGECFTQSGDACPARDDDDDDTSSSSNPSSTGDPGAGGSGPGAGGAGSGGFGSGELFALCDGDGDCASGRCAPDGYCTKECANYEECEWPKGDCPKTGVPADAQQLCAPTCGVFNDQINQPEPDPAACDAYDGLGCGYAKAVDGFAVLVCSSWPDGVPLPPDGTECDPASWDNLQCNLGYLGAESVCSSFGVCATDACYTDDDCPAAETCSSPDGSTLGTCN